jgi:hypothetical protein
VHGASRCSGSRTTLTSDVPRSSSDPLTARTLGTLEPSLSRARALLASISASRCVARTLHGEPPQPGSRRVRSYHSELVPDEGGVHPFEVVSFQSRSRTSQANRLPTIG